MTSAAAQEQRRAPTPLLPLAVTWSADTGFAAADPAYDAERAFVSLRSGQLVALSLADGSRLWSVDLATTRPPAVDAGLVFAAAGDVVQAVDALTGQARWQRPLGALAAPLLAEGGWLVAGLERGDVVVMRAVDGSEVWHKPIGVRLAAPPAIAGRALYLPLEDGRVAALDLMTGEETWQRKLGGRPAQVLGLADRAYVGATDNFFYCLSPKDGEIRWRWRTGADVVGRPAVDESRVYFVSLDNVLRALDRASGVLKWAQPLASRPLAGPLIVGDLLFVPSLSNQLRAYIARSGRPAAAVALPSELVTAPHAVPATVGQGGPTATGPEEGAAAEVRAIVLMTDEGFVYALGRAADPALTPLDFVPGTPVAPPSAAEVATASRIAPASRVTPSTIRSGEGAENDSRRMLRPAPLTKKALPTT